MRLSLTLAFLFTSTVALAADRQINQISVEQSDSDTIIRLFGSDLIRSPKDRVFFAAEASSYSVEPTMMYGDSEYVEVALGMPVMAGQYRISIGPNENTSNLESMVVIGAIGPRGPAGRDGADGRDGVDGMDGSPGADGQDGMDGADGQDGAKGDPGADGADGSSCSVIQTTSGATLSCTDGTMASIFNGTDGVIGSNGSDGADGQDGENGVDGSSCSVEEIDGGAVVSCTDGTSAVLAGAGSQFYINPTIAINPVNLLPTGEIVLVDAQDNILGLVTRSNSFPDYFDADLAFNTSDGTKILRFYIQTEEVFFSNDGEMFYLTPDCSGTGFFDHPNRVHYYPASAEPDEGYSFFVADLAAERLPRLFKSKRLNGPPFVCEAMTAVNTLRPAIAIELPFLLEPILPVRLEQLPL